MRTIYQWVLRLHPARFRRRFEDEMLLIYDETSRAKGRLCLIFDGMCSAFRQWVFRSAHWRDESSQSVVPVSSAVPRFVCLESSGVRGAALAAGGVLTFSFLVGLSFFATLGSRPVVNDPWANWPRTRGMDPNTGETGLLSSFVKVGRRPGTDYSSSRSATPAERRVLEWLLAYNAGDIQRVHAFHHHAEHSFYDPSAAEREVQLWNETFLSTGRLRLVSLSEQSQYSLVAVCEDSHGTFWRIRLMVEPHWPNQIVLLEMGEHVLLDARNH